MQRQPVGSGGVVIRVGIGIELYFWVSLFVADDIQYRPIPQIMGENHVGGKVHQQPIQPLYLTELIRYKMISDKNIR